MNLGLEEILKALNGKVVVKGREDFKVVSTDTRKIEVGSLFIALKGNNFNGNLFIKEAVEKGATICIVDEIHFQSAEITDSTIIKVDNTTEALKDLAEFYRKKLKIKVVGVTGSTGKTSTKDLIAAALSTKYKVFKTKGNFNNEIGLPLMVFQLDETYDVAVLEMGMSDFNEIHNLSKIARPDIAVITNIGISHIENLKTRDNILKAKMEITDFLKEKSPLILSGNDDKLVTVENSNFNVIKVGLDNKDYCIDNIKFLENETQFNTIIDGEKVKFTIPLLGKHNVYNTLLALCVGRNLGVSVTEMQQGMANLEATSMRLDIMKKDKYTIINDCYNSSPASVKAAIEVQKNLSSKRKVAILGTMKELGLESKSAHFEVGKFAKDNDVDLLLLTGEFTEEARLGYGEKNAYIYTSVSELINDLDNKIKIGDSILVKASRSMKFEQIIESLDKK
ncbi:UDP-N-acetylmuramoyl-tripeptide--D-alanyl-D-alanine ligase [Clostridium sp. TW13]|uniref:UDP-N-acetylmuramoyl-tripeptide--D-alanyl-D-alanine ligase n=2 Tax=Inconstantimicrobium mannanitabidum TaxID=1604901 RepID=A0ACB5RAT5_9CLOT|nr:UDP-N-acetylmuramoyl-tripeptide--D-alanyl-D-alanine ligase [Clostridium sp. TW13]